MRFVGGQSMKRDLFKVGTYLMLLGATTITSFNNSYATDIYLSSASGNDSATTPSQTTPWKSLSKVNSRSVSPGDRIFLKGGETFSGGLSFNGRGGTAAAPVTISSY